MAAERIKLRAAKILNANEERSHGANVVKQEEILLRDKSAFAPDGRSVSLIEIALDTLHHNEQEQIMGMGSYVSPAAPPPFAAQFAEVTIDTETGAVTVDNLLMAVDSGVIVNPQTASGQIEGGMAQALGYTVCEEMVYDEKGRARERDFGDYHIFRSNEMPELTTIFVETFEPTHPFGIKAVAEIPLDGVAPAVGNAILDAIGINLDEIPITPEKVWRAINPSNTSSVQHSQKNVTVPLNTARYK
jgi:putative selenate reductase molybdopterin-binding subunit